MASETTDALEGSCAGSCSLHYMMQATCQCYYGCDKYSSCCSDFSTHCDGMAKIEEDEKLALSHVAAFTVFYAIIMFVALLVVLLWAFYTLYNHCKKHGGGSAFESSGFILRDNKAMLALSYCGMTFYVLSLFCYLISNASLGIEYNATNDTYGNSQVAAIILWFFGHSLFYILFMVKLFYFMRKTTYHISGALQCGAFTLLIVLWLTSCIVFIVWIEEFHNHYHYGSIDTAKVLACMIIAFASHVWFCLALILFFSLVLYRVMKIRGTTLIDASSASDRLSKSELTQKVTHYMTRITVLCTVPLCVTVFCMLCWMILIGAAPVSDAYLRFCWWLFPVNVLFGFLSMLLGLNFHPNMNDIYKRLCICPHAFCEFYCVRAVIPFGKKKNKGIQVRDYDDEDEDEDNALYDSKDDKKQDEDEDEDDSSRSQSAQNAFSAMPTDETANILEDGEKFVVK